MIPGLQPWPTARQVSAGGEGRSARTDPRAVPAPHPPGVVPARGLERVWSPTVGTFLQAGFLQREAAPV
jgi:hypothetical protein